MACIRSNKTLKLFLLVVIIFVVTNTILYSIVKYGHVFQLYNGSKSASVMHLRRVKLNTFCTVRNVTYDEKSPDVLNVLKKLIISRNQFTYCPVYEAATDVVLKMIGEMDGLLTYQVKDFIKNNDNTWKKIIKHSYDLGSNPDILMETEITERFLVVRHPFERILAVYRKNFEKKPQDNKYKTYFEKELGANWTSQMDTFKKFLLYFVRNSKFDNDLLPICDQCLPCLVGYPFIIDYDTFIRDSEFFLESIYSDKKLAQFFEEEKNDPLFTDMYMSKYYYSNIPLILMQQLYSIYEDDFIFFGYSPHYFFTL